MTFDIKCDTKIVLVFIASLLFILVNSLLEWYLFSEVDIEEKIKAVFESVTLIVLILTLFVMYKQLHIYNRQLTSSYFPKLSIKSVKYFLYRSNSTFPLTVYLDSEFDFNSSQYKYFNPYKGVEK
ncbi:MAG: hypothetical protein D3903_03710 [Candidatus Electrothrix sp. GM3_4]|nr:hypothetical protein [Candidatus Electrothrix sp. GM3_4]